MANKGLCSRCNYAYATTIDDNLPVCETCKSKVAEEAVRQCPVDGEDMKKIFINNVMIDKCPKCKGIWLDGNEVDLLSSLAQNYSSDSKSSKDDCGKGNSKFWQGLIIGAIISD